jgi:hypothetical protein
LPVKHFTLFDIGDVDQTPPRNGTSTLSSYLPTEQSVYTFL